MINYYGFGANYMGDPLTVINRPMWESNNTSSFGDRKEIAIKESPVFRVRNVSLSANPPTEIPLG